MIDLTRWAVEASALLDFGLILDWPIKDFKPRRARELGFWQQQGIEMPYVLAVSSRPLFQTDHVTGVHGNVAKSGSVPFMISSRISGRPSTQV